MIQSTFSATTLTSTGHLQSFVNFASTFCKDCITSTLVPAPAAAATTYRLLAEDGVTEITLENGGDINLQ
jgi:uroporphyrinogen-III synthase